MVDVDDIRTKILELANGSGPEKSFGVLDIARALDSKNWRNLLHPVKFVMEVLIREGKIANVRSGKSLTLRIQKARQDTT